MDDATLRQRLTEVLDKRRAAANPADPWVECVFGWINEATDDVDALMPVVREALAETWDDGHATRRDEYGNPWREDDQ